MACVNVIFRCYPDGATVLIDGGFWNGLWISGEVDNGSGVSKCLELGTHTVQWAKIGYNTGQSYNYVVTQQMIDMGGTHTDWYTMSPLKCTAENCPYPNTCYNDVCGGSPDCTPTNCPYPSACDGYTCTSSCDPFSQSYGRIHITPAGSTVTVVGDAGVDHVIVPSTTEGLHLCLLAPYYYHTLRYEHAGYIAQEEVVNVGAANTSFGDRTITLVPEGGVCTPSCVPPQTCQTINGMYTCADPVASPCDGMNRNGVFDVNCLFENPMYILAGAAVLALLLSRR